MTALRTWLMTLMVRKANWRTKIVLPRKPVMRWVRRTSTSPMAASRRPQSCCKGPSMTSRSVVICALKLMEVYAEMGDRNGFARQDNELREIGGSAAELDQINARYPAMAVAAGVGVAAAATATAATGLDGFSLDDLAFDEQNPKAAAADQDDAFDLSLDDLESELDRDLQAAGNDAALDGLDSLSLDSDSGFQFAG